MIQQEIRAWSRVRLDRERADLEQEDLSYAVNADLFLEHGSIRPRRGCLSLQATTLGGSVRRLIRQDERRYQVVKESAYRNGSSVITGLSSEHVTSMQAALPLSDDTTWVFIADKAKMKKDNGTTVGNWGIVDNTSTLTLAAGATGSLTGSYNVKITGVRFSASGTVAHEGNPCGAAATAVSVTNQNVTIYNIIPPAETDANGIGVYRTVASGAAYLLDARVRTDGNADCDYTVTYGWEIADLPATAVGLIQQLGNIKTDGTVCTYTWELTANNTSNHEDVNGYTGTHAWERGSYGEVTTQTVRFAYISTIADNALGSAVETDNDAPPNCGFVSEPYQERLWLCQDADYPHYLRYAKRLRPESVPADFYLELTSADDKVLAFAPIGGIGIAFTQRSKYRVMASGTDTFQFAECPSKRGTPAWKAVCAEGDGVYFAARDGVFRTTGFAIDEQLANPILPIFQGEDKNGFRAINWDVVETFSLEIYQGRLYFAYADIDHTEPNMLGVHLLRTDRWQFYAFPFAVTSMYHERDTGYLTVGASDGKTYRIEHGIGDNGDDITMTADSKDYGHVTNESPAGVMARHLFRFTADDIDPDGGTVTGTFYVDGAATAPTQSITATRTPIPASLPTTAQGYRWRKRWTYTGTGTPKIYGTTVSAMPMRAAK